jgi:AcrR family transcriptional regulator
MGVSNQTRPAEAGVGFERRDGRGGGNVAEIQRARMLNAALHAIEQSGYAHFTVAQVIERAKVSRKTFYDVFEDREDCFVALFEQALERVGARASEAYARERSWREGVRAGLAAMLQFIEDEPLLARLCVVDALGAGPRVLQRRGEAMARLRSAIERGQRERDGRREPPAVTAEGVIGAVFAVLHTRLLRRSSEPYMSLLGPLMSMIVLPYLGAAAASRELARPAPRRQGPAGPARRAAREDPLAGLQMRLTYRTVSVLSAIGELPGASNREVADRVGIVDQGQVSKLLARLQRLELIENVKDGEARGAPNRWRLTERGGLVERATRPM